MARSLDVMLVIDVESTCWDGEPPTGQSSEIIEIGVCPVDLNTLERLEKRSILIKPKRSTVSDFCTELTTLTPQMVAAGVSLEEGIRTLKKEFDSKNRLWASWGDYDRRQFERVCRESKIGYPFGPSHMNAKSLFAASLGLRHEVGMDAALSKLQMPMDGTHHRGHDDAWNIAGIICHLFRTIRNR